MATRRFVSRLIDRVPVGSVYLMPVVLIMVIIGTLLILQALAATDHISLEAEDGRSTGLVTDINDASASGGGFTRFESAPVPTPTPSPTPTPLVTPVPTHTATPVPTDPLAIACVPPTLFPPPPVGGMTYANWDFSNDQLSSITMEIEVLNDAGTGSTLYYQSYDGRINGLYFYMGIQTNGMTLFSIFGAGEPVNARTGPGSTITNDLELGDQFLSVRHQYGSLPVGTYTTRLTKAEGGASGDWFDYYLTRPGESEQFIGGIRVARPVADTPLFMSDKGGTWTEFWANNYADRPLLPVPEFTVISTVKDARGPTGEALRLESVFLTYSSMPNSDMAVLDLNTLTVRHHAGGNTPRCHRVGTVSAITN
jgi:hypothetical protein